MLPELFSVGSVTVHTYGILVAVGVLAAITLAEVLHRKAGGKPGRMMDMSFIVVLAGLVGARTVYVVVNLGYYADRPLETLMFWKGGLVFYGGLAGGAVALLGSVLYYRLSVREIMDIGAAAVCIGHAFGRLGCFAAGCCYGRPSDYPWAVTFTDPACLALEVINKPVHPVQLYSFLFLSMLTVFLVWLYGRRTFRGQVAATYLIFYSLFRFSVEFLRGDPRGTLEILGATLSVSQWLSLLVFLLGAGTYFKLSRMSRRTGIQEPGDRSQ